MPVFQRNSHFSPIEQRLEWHRELVELSGTSIVTESQARVVAIRLRNRQLTAVLIKEIKHEAKLRRDIAREERDARLKETRKNGKLRRKIMRSEREEGREGEWENCDSTAEAEGNGEGEV
jgi:hypothetical protein